MISIDKLSGKPVYEQLIDSIERYILLDVYPAGSMIPSLRELSASLKINPNTIQKSYAELTRRGVIAPSPGNGSFVTPDAKERILQRAYERLEAVRRSVAELRLAGLPEETVLDAVRAVYRETDRTTALQGGPNE